MRLVISDFDSEPQAQIGYLGAGPNRSGPGNFLLPIYTARLEGLPASLDALVVTSDLQGLERARRSDGTHRLLGEQVAQELRTIVKLKPSARVGVLLCGDFHSHPQALQRGGIGDVTPVWAAFATHFDWVVGVAGNHDLFEPGPGLSPELDNVALLDGKSTQVGALTVGGVSGIVGKPSKPQRKDGEAYSSLVDHLLTQGCQILLLHESPSTSERGRGNHAVRELLQDAGSCFEDEVPLVCCGHTRWDEPLVQLDGGVQVLNVDHRVVVLRR